MRVTMLGTGAAFADPDRCQSGILISTESGRHYLLECGSGITRQMVRAGVSPSEVSAVVLSHLHHDHVVDFPMFAITGWMWNRQDSPIVFGPKGIRTFCDRLFEGGAFDVDFRARAAYPLRQSNLAAVRPDARELVPGPFFDDGHVRMSCAWVDHLPHDVCECFGIRVEADGKSVAFSGDTKPCDGMLSLAEGVDLLIHEATFPEAFLQHRAKSGVGTFAHTSPTELGKLATRAGVKSLVATHFGHFDTTSPVIKRVAGAHLPVDLMGPHMLDEVVREIRLNYAGPLRLAHDLMRIDL